MELFSEIIARCVWTSAGERYAKKHSNTPRADDQQRAMEVVRAAVLVMNAPMNARRSPPREMRDVHLRLLSSRLIH